MIHTTGAARPFGAFHLVPFYIGRLACVTVKSRSVRHIPFVALKEPFPWLSIIRNLTPVVDHGPTGCFFFKGTPLGGGFTGKPEGEPPCRGSPKKTGCRFGRGSTGTPKGFSTKYTQDTHMAPGTTGLSHCFHLPECHFGITLFLTHSHIPTGCFFFKVKENHHVGVP